jgi:alanyl-tRNA synthetase
VAFGGCHDIAGRLIDTYQRYCESKNITFARSHSVKSFEYSTLFCSAGMQQFKRQFIDPAFVGTFANIQSCLRLGDLAEIGDGIHALNFNMMGLFSFRELSVPQTIAFWLEFLDQINASPDYVTIHPKRMAEWSRFYPSQIPIHSDPSCTWSDGSVSGFCTEFYKNGIEIGNIVNPLGTCIDVGFGLERLDMIVHGTAPATQHELLVSAIETIIEAGYRPGNKE